MLVYYVRRSDYHRPTLDIEGLSLKMSTPDKDEALRNAAERAILNPGYHYYVFGSKDNALGWFYVEDEEN